MKRTKQAWRGTGVTLPQFADDASRWEAIQKRDSTADDAFFYSVATTGVYCRPSCGARLPRRENVRFHSTSEGARRAGFRACKRCRPSEPRLAERRREAVARACRHIESATVAPTLPELADAAGLSPYHFHRVFKMITGVTPKAYAAAHRARHVRAELAKGTTITAAMYGSGFNSNGGFYANSTAHLWHDTHGVSFRRGCATIRFAMGECSLGSVLVAATEKGICAIFLGDDSAALARELRDRFPKACIVTADAEFERRVERVVGMVEQPAARPRSSARHPGNCLSGTGLGGLAMHSSRINRELYPDRRVHWSTHGRASGCFRMRGEPDRHRHSLSSRGQDR